MKFEVLEGKVTLMGAVLDALLGKYYSVIASSNEAFPILMAADRSRVRFYEDESSILHFGKNYQEASRLFDFNGYPAQIHNSKTFALLIAPASSLRKILRIRTPWIQSFPQQINSRILISGPRQSGKSTFARILCNTLLCQHKSQGLIPKVQFLEADPAHPEVGLCGQIGLYNISDYIFGPSYTHFADSESITYNLGTTRADDFPESYMLHIEALLQESRRQQSTLIINTPGWTRGVGADLIESIIKMASPVYQYYLGLPHEEEPLSNLTGWTYLDPVDTHNSPQSPASLRLLSYLHRQGNKWNFDIPLIAMKPLRLSYVSDAFGGITVRSDMSIGPKELSKVINANTLSIIFDPGPLPLVQYSVPEGIPFCNKPLHNSSFIPQMVRGTCLLRGIDTRRKELHLITPESGLQDFEAFRLEYIAGSDVAQQIPRSAFLSSGKPTFLAPLPYVSSFGTMGVGWQSDRPKAVERKSHG